MFSRPGLSAFAVGSSSLSSSAAATSICVSPSAGASSSTATAALATQRRFGGHGPVNRLFHTQWFKAYPAIMQERERDMYHSYYPYLFDHGDKMSLYPKVPSNPREWQPEQMQTFYDAIREDKYDAFLRLREKFPELYADTQVWNNPPPFGEFNQFYSVRFGLIGVKAFTCKDYDAHGNEMNLTALWVADNQVIAHRSKGAPGTDKISIGAMNVPAEFHPPHVAAAYKARNVPVKHVNCEFPITPDAYVPVGTKLDVRHFRAGQEVDVGFQSTDYGFQGVMTRYGFDGGWVWLGDSRWQRRRGALSTEGAGRVYPGTRNAGQTGAKNTVKSGIPIWRIDYKNSLIYINALLDADIGAYVRLSDTINTKGLTTWSEHRGKPAFPTFIPAADEDLSALATEECQLVSLPLYHQFKDEHSKTSLVTQEDIDDAQSAKPAAQPAKRKVYDMKKYVEARKKVRQGNRKARKWKLAGQRARAAEAAEETRRKKQLRFKRVK